MNKLAISGLLLLLGLSLIACGNRQLIDTNYTFTKAVVKIGADYKTVQLKTWKDYEKDNQIQIVTTDGHVYLVDKSNITLIDK